ncbi:MAG: AMP-binding protein [bacterium]|jgi:long-chain acyl-CoA synthetase|nr:AMP-binding protein [bacterium]
MNLFHAFQETASRFAGQTAIQWEAETYTYAQTETAALQIASALSRQAGDAQNIAFLMPNTPCSVFALLGILAAGKTAVPFNPNLTETELAALLAHSDSPLLLYDPAWEEKARLVVARTGQPVHGVNIRSFTKAGEGEGLASMDPAERALILYTSGTTGDPKGVMLSHRSVYSNYTAFAERVGLASEQTLLAILPIFHSFGITTILFGGLLTGARVILSTTFAPAKAVEWVVNEPAVVVAGVPPMLYMLAQFAPTGAAARHHLVNGISGGGPLPLEFHTAFQAAYNHPLIEGYGLTETSPVVAQNNNATNKPGTIGRPLAGVETEVRAPDGAPQPAGTVGELWVRGPLLMQGYYKNPVSTQAAMDSAGWFRTGDLATFDAEGYIQIVGRCKDLIVSSGENIYPREIEERLLHHPAVAEAAVVGKPDRLRAEIPHAFIVLRPGCSATAGQLRQYCGETLAAFKIPDGFTFIDAMPKTATHKIKKEILKATFRR